MELIRLSIPEPCTEDWEQMTPESRGRFCSACSKRIIDFSTFSDEEFIAYFQAHTSIHCGRYTRRQLKLDIPVASLEDISVQTTFAPLPMIPIKNRAHTSPLKTLPFLPHIRGRVKTFTGAAIQGAWIVWKETNKIALTDLNGHFSIPGIQGRSELICIAPGKPLIEIKITDLSKTLFIYC